MIIKVLLSVTIFVTTANSECVNGNGCSPWAACDVEFVDNAVYGCSGEWTSGGVSNGEWICGDGYSICKSASYASSLGLTHELCTSNTLIQPNYFYASLQSGPGDLICDSTGVNDLFGCASPDGFAYVPSDVDFTNCGPFGAQMSEHTGNRWLYGWETYCNNGVDELTCTRHLTMNGVVTGGVVCCKDSDDITTAPPVTTPAPITSAPTPQPIYLPNNFSPAQLNRISEWKSRTIYQIVTDRFSKTDNGGNVDCSDLNSYCGGTFKGIIEHLDYIQGMGYDAIWISPIIENTDNGYHGYWSKNLYEINNNFGTENDYFELVQALHDRDMYLMVDVVFNHMGYTAINNDFSELTPFNDIKYYHDSCNNELCTNCGIYNWYYYSNEGLKEIEQCRLAGLPDLDQSNDETLDLLCDWLNDYVIDKWMADAIRIDTVPEVHIKYWLHLLSGSCLKDNIFNIGEYFWGDPAILGEFQPVFDSLFGYPMYYTIRDVFGDQHGMNKISERLDQYKSEFIDYSALGLFIDNHDNQRWLCSFKDKENKITNYKNALLFIHTFPGIPILYYGTEQSFSGCSDPENREVLWTTDYNVDAEIYKYIKIVLKYRKQYEIYNGEFNLLQSEEDLVVFSRGDNTLIILTNNGATFNRSITINNKIKSATYCDIFNNEDCFEYDNSDKIGVWIQNGNGKLYVSMNKTEETIIKTTKYYDPATTILDRVPTGTDESGVDTIYTINIIFMSVFITFLS